MSNISSESRHLSSAVKGIYLPLGCRRCMSLKRTDKDVKVLDLFTENNQRTVSTRQERLLLYLNVYLTNHPRSKFGACDSNVKVFNDTVGINRHYFPIYISFQSHECLLSQSRSRSQVSQFQSLVSLLQNSSTMTRCHSSCKSQIDFL